MEKLFGSASRKLNARDISGYLSKNDPILGASQSEPNAFVAYTQFSTRDCFIRN